MLRVALVEDDAADREELRSFLQVYGAERGLELRISEFSSGGALLEGYRPVYDIIFLDIAMPGIDGMETAERLRAWDGEVVLVFVTNLPQYAIRGYSVGALDYVLKPVSYHTFSPKLERAVELVRRRASGQVLLRLPDGAVRLETRQIHYVEVQRGILHYRTSLGEFTVRGTLQSVEQELGRYHFVRCNYWYLVNLMHVSKVKRDVVEVAGTELQISRRSRPAFMTALADYAGGVL